MMYFALCQKTYLQQTQLSLAANYFLTRLKGWEYDCMKMKSMMLLSSIMTQNLERSSIATNSLCFAIFGQPD